MPIEDSTSTNAVAGERAVDAVRAAIASQPQGSAIARQFAVLQRRYNTLVNVVIPLGAALSAEHNYDRMLERILTEARTLCNADGGTLYLLEEDELRFAIIQNVSLGIKYGGGGAPKPPFTPLPMHEPGTQLPNQRHVAVHAAITGQTVNVPDAYASDAFNFTGTRRFDESTGYRSRSLLAVPLKDPQGQVIGVIQILNSHDWTTGGIVAFDDELQRAVEALALLAASALYQHQREQKLHEKIRELNIRIDQADRSRQVSEIAGTDYFQTLAVRAAELRKRYQDNHR